MIRHGLVLFLASTGVPALAQETMTFNIEYGAPVVGPGQSQTIKVWAHFEPGLGQPAVWNTLGAPAGGLPGTVLVFFNATFDLNNVLNGQTGVFSNLALNPILTNGIAQVGVPTPSGDVVGIHAQQSPAVWPPGSYANPILLWSATWTPSTYDPRTVVFGSATLFNSVILEVGLSNVQDQWDPINPQSSFQVIPAPPVASALALGALFATRRRR